MIYAAKYSNEVSGLILVDTTPRNPEERRSRPVRTSPPEFFESRDEALTYFKERFPSFTSEAYENRLKHGLEMMPDGKFA